MVSDVLIPFLVMIVASFLLLLFQQGNFNSSIGSDGYMLSSLTCGMAPVTSITEGLQQVSCACNQADGQTDTQCLSLKPSEQRLTEDLATLSAV